MLFCILSCNLNLLAIPRCNLVQKCPLSRELRDRMDWADSRWVGVHRTSRCWWPPIPRGRFVSVLLIPAVATCYEVQPPGPLQPFLQKTKKQKCPHNDKLSIPFLLQLYKTLSINFSYPCSQQTQYSIETSQGPDQAC